MRVGDLVALSSYGSKLDALYTYSDNFRSKYRKDKQPLVGIIINTTIPEYGHHYYSENERVRYYIKWFKPTAPKGRDSSYGGDYFYRKDLKFVSKRA